MHKSWPEFATCLTDFFVTGLAAAVVNSGIKFLTNAVTVAFRRRLTEYVHSRYLAHRNYYRAAVLRLGNLDNADARIVEDLNQFCSTAADLFSRTFKPALDVLLSTQRMGASMGYGGLALLYGYFIASGAAVRFVSPPIPRLTAEQAALVRLRYGYRRTLALVLTSAISILLPSRRATSGGRTRGSSRTPRRLRSWRGRRASRAS